MAYDDDEEEGLDEFQTQIDPTQEEEAAGEPEHGGDFVGRAAVVGSIRVRIHPGGGTECSEQTQSTGPSVIQVFVRDVGALGM